MHRIAWKIMVLAFVGTLVLVPRARAQQDPFPRPHAPGTLMVADTHDEDEEHEHGRRGPEADSHRLRRPLCSTRCQ